MTPFVEQKEKGKISYSEPKSGRLFWNRVRQRPGSLEFFRNRLSRNSKVKNPLRLDASNRLRGKTCSERTLQPKRGNWPAVGQTRKNRIYFDPLAIRRYLPATGAGWIPTHCTVSPHSQGTQC